MAARPKGGFRVMKRSEEQWEVYFKHYATGFMTLIADQCSRAEAESMKQALDRCLPEFVKDVSNFSN